MFTTAQFYSPAAYYHFFSALFGEESKPPPPVPINDLDEFLNVLTSDETEVSDWIKYRDEIKILIKKEAGENLDDLDSFIDSLMEWGCKRDPQKTLSFLMDVVDLEILDHLAVYITATDEIPYDDIFEWASEQKAFCPKPSNKTLKNYVVAEWTKCRPQILYFIPNLIDIFLGAFTLLDSNKKYTSLWDKYLLLEIVYKFFLIPVCLVQLLRPFVKVTVKVYLIAAAIMASLGILLACYQRWLKPLPNEIINCTNLDHQMELGFIDPTVGQEQELEKLLEALLVGSNVLLVGRSGEGKTALMHHLIQLKQQEKLPPELQNLTTFELDCGLMVSNVSYGHSELINQTREQIEGHEDEVLFFLDEFYQLASNKDAFQAFKKRFLVDKPTPRFVATITMEEFTQLKALDIDGSFMRRVVLVHVESSSEEQNRLVLYELVNRIAKDIPVLDEAIDTALELSEDEDFLPAIGRPAKAIKILTDAIGSCRAAYSPHYVPQKLNEGRQHYEALRTRAIHETKPDKALHQQMRELRTNISTMEAELDAQNQKVKKIKKMIDYQVKLKEEYFHLTHLIGDVNEQEDPPTDAVSEKAQKLFLLYYFYAIDTIKEIIQEEIEQIIEERPIQVDGDLVEQAYENFKFIEAKLNDNDSDVEEEDSDGEEEEEGDIIV